MKTCAIATLALALFCATGIAQAAPITWGPDLYDPTDLYFESGGAECSVGSVSATCESLAYEHDLTTLGFVAGVSSPDQLTGGLLEILLRDDQSDRPSEGFKISIEDLLQPGTENASTTFSFSGIAGNILASLQDDGVLHVVLRHQHGDFIFDRSTFTAVGTREELAPAPATVPEPGTLILLGAAAIGWRFRRVSASSQRKTT